MGGFVKETRSLHPAEELLPLLWRNGAGGWTVRDPCWLGWDTQPSKSPCQLHVGTRGELWAFKSPAGGKSGWAATGWQIVSVGEFILSSPTLDT